MTCLILVATVLLVLCVVSVGAGGKAPGSKKTPHILFIVADDFGYNDVGYHQNKKSSANPRGLPTTNAAAGILPTPTLDQLAAEGVKLENYYVQPLCSPTRSTIMTGRYPSHTGIGPDVDRIDWPYGVPAEEVFFPERLRAAGYKSHMVGKWHLGACHERYTPTFRGFDSYVGYMSGGQGYYNQRYDRNSSCSDVLGTCLGPAFEYNYSSVFFAREAIRLIDNHDDQNEDNPMFLYLAFQSVHNPYDEPPMDVNKTFPDIVDYRRRIYAGMVKMLDSAVGQVVDALRKKGMWDDTVLVFTTDNGGIDVGSNYPLRGSKVLNWEGGIKAVGFVRGTNNRDLSPLPSGTTCNELMHSTDWFLTLVEGLAGGDAGDALPLDGYNQWDVLAGAKQTDRTTIFHQVPVGATPVETKDADGKKLYTTSMCMHNVDDRTLPCSSFGVTGGAMREREWKLLITYPGDAGWEDTSPKGVPQYTPGGTYPNGTDVFVPTTNDTIPEPFRGKYFLFDLSKDPTETNNLAEAMPEKLSRMLAAYDAYAETARPSLAWRWGFTDPNRGNNPGNSGAMTSSSNGLLSLRGHTGDIAVAADGPAAATADVKETCTGPFLGSFYCAYGHEWECYVMGNDLAGYDVGTVDADGTVECQRACASDDECNYWVLVNQRTCKLKSARGDIVACATCVFGPKHCPS